MEAFDLTLYHTRLKGALPSRDQRFEPRRFQGRGGSGYRQDSHGRSGLTPLCRRRRNLSCDRSRPGRSLRDSLSFFRRSSLPRPLCRALRPSRGAAVAEVDPPKNANIAATATSASPRLVVRSSPIDALLDALPPIGPLGGGVSSASSPDGRPYYELPDGAGCRDSTRQVV